MWNAYLGALGRVPDHTVAGTSETEKVYYARQLDDAAATAGGREAVIDKAQEIAAMLFNSTEYTSVTRTDEQYVRDLYEVYLQRAPDTAGLAQWTAAAGGSGGRASVLNTFAGMTAFRELAGTIYREVNWIVTDHLGTPRMIVDRAGSLAGVKRHDYLPFGEELGAGVGGRTAGQGYVADNVRQKFAGSERDGETGLDFMQARYYSSAMGRFTSVDPLDPVIGKQGAKDKEEAEKEFRQYISQPAHWNRYVYALNNPLKFNDPDGFAERLRVSVNIVWDENSKYTEKEKQEVRDTYIKAAVDNFKGIEIDLELKETTGSAANIGFEERRISEGYDKESVNIFFTKTKFASSDEAAYGDGRVFINTSAALQNSSTHGLMHAFGIVAGMNGYASYRQSETAVLKAQATLALNLGSYSDDRSPRTHIQEGFSSGKGIMKFKTVQYQVTTFDQIRDGARRFLKK